MKKIDSQTLKFTTADMAFSRPATVANVKMAVMMPIIIAMTRLLVPNPSTP